MTGLSASAQRLRRLYALLAVCTIVCGLLWRRPELGLPPLAAKYGGSALWGAMVFFVVASILPAVRLPVLAGIAAVIAAGVEFSQLLHSQWLDDFRRTTIGVLLLGRFFDWWDIAAYWAGIGAVCTILTLTDRRHEKAPGMAQPSFKGTRSARIAVGLAIASAILAVAAGLLIYLALAFQTD